MPDRSNGGPVTVDYVGGRDTIDPVTRRRNVHVPVPQECALDLLRYLVLETRGGETRARILELLLERPRNSHEIARELGLNYGTVTGHLRRLVRGNLVLALTAERYAQGFGVAPIVRENARLLRNPRRRDDGA